MAVTIGDFSSRLVEYHNILVTPTSEETRPLYGRGTRDAHPRRPRSKDGWAARARGGVQFPADCPPWVHQCRGGRLFRQPYPVPDVEGDVELLAGKYLYGGPCWRHFGHFVGEFMHRLWPLGMPEYADATVVFTLNEGQAAPPGFIPHILDVFGCKAPLFVDRNVRLEHLVCAESGKMLEASPAPDYLDFLDRRIGPVLQPLPDTPRKLAVLRGHLPKGNGHCIGETWLAEALATHGYFVFQPENYPVKTQMQYYAGAESIVFSEGSAIHLLDITPRLQARIAVLARRATSTLAEHTLGMKCRELCLYRDCVGLLLPNTEVYTPARALTWVDPNGFLDFLHANGFIEQPHPTRFLDDADQLIDEVVSYYSFMTRPGKDRDAPARVEVLEGTLAYVLRQIGHIRSAGTR